MSETEAPAADLSASSAPRQPEESSVPPTPEAPPAPASMEQAAEPVVDAAPAPEAPSDPTPAEAAAEPVAPAPAAGDDVDAQVEAEMAEVGGSMDAVMEQAAPETPAAPAASGEGEDSGEASARPARLVRQTAPHRDAPRPHRRHPWRRRLHRRVRRPVAHGQEAPRRHPLGPVRPAAPAGLDHGLRRRPHR